MYSLLKKLLLFSLLTLASPVLSLPTSDPNTNVQNPPRHQFAARDTSLPLIPHVIHQFPKPTWVENLAVRLDSGSGILCTIFTAPDLYLVSPSSGTATLLHSFPSVLGLSGIAQLGHDIFYVAGGNFSFVTFQNTPESYGVWEVDIRGYDKHGVAGVKVRKVVDIKEALLLNGVTRLDSKSKTLLIADSELGAVWEVDVSTGKYKLGIDIPEMKAASSGGIPIGVNGIKVKDGYLYFSNSELETLSRVAIDPMSGSVTGSVEVLASGIQPDDFTLGEDGLIWIAQNARNTVSVLLKNGTVVNVAGSVNSLAIPGPSSCQFGRSDKLFCGTTGGLASSVNGTFIGGQIIEFDTKGFDL